MIGVKKLFYFIDKPKIQIKLIYIFSVLFVSSCLSTYLLLADLESYNKNSSSVVFSLYLDAVFILILLFLTCDKFINLWLKRYKKGSKITLRLVVTFTLLAIVPSVSMCFFSAIFFHKGIESWFNKRNQEALWQSLKIAESYIDHCKKNALDDCEAISKVLEYHMASELIDFIDEYTFSRKIGALLDDWCNLKGTDSAVLLNANLDTISYSKYSVSLFFLNIDDTILEKARSSLMKGIVLDETVTGMPENIVILRYIPSEIYLLISKKIDSQLLLEVNNMKTAYVEYNKLSLKRNTLEIIFVFIFLILSIFLLIAAALSALVYSERILNPISDLIDTAEDIIKGNKKARTTENSKYEEIRLLSETFNRMMDKNVAQYSELVGINQKLDEKIEFINSVLVGVSSGIIGTENNVIYIWNSAAEKLLGKEIIFGEHIGNIFPEINELITEKINFLKKEIQFRKENEVLLFSLKIKALPFQDENKLVIAFDDITEISIAHKRAAWSEVAERVAHEIKNPLTPIQLAAERIRRKYLSQITNESDTFSGLIDVIMRQVEDIKRLLNEFNFFARLPKPQLKKCNFSDICNEVVFFMQNINADIDLSFSPPNLENAFIRADERLIHQSLVNLIQNAINALATIEKENKKIVISLEQREKHIKVLIEDNGPGLPEGKKEVLTTPYFTLMPKGTGLGLAIVKKIVQDHGGELSLGDSIYGGARVEMSIPSWDCLNGE
ncbi:MAG: GHKL domain-containing protein [Holosporaceae bacterium]|jgi:two-component system nitrogen regulation sensor histidine kinase NtrY|nr:GHKL domain-containing protein [Holosporaceae bacterium]